MSTNKKLLGIGLALTSFATIAAAAVSGGSMPRLKTGLFKADAAVDVATTYSLLLDESWGYSGEATKAKTSAGNNDFTIGFSNGGSDFSGAAAGNAFSTTADGAYLYTVSLLSGISQIYVKGTSTNEKAGVTVYGHYYRQTECVDDSETVSGTLNSLIEFEPTNYVTIQFEGTDNIESVEIGYSCSEASDPFDHMVSGGQHTDGNGLFQSMTGISTDLPVGTNVHVTMDVAVTGTFDSDACQVYWVNDVYSSSGGEGDKSRTSIKSIVVNGDTGWHTIEFDATVRNFPNLRYNAKYVTQDTSSFGNAIYLIAVTHASLDSFNYRNVEMTANYYAMAPSGNNGNNNDMYYQSIGVLTTELSEGASVQVEMDVCVTGTYNSYSYVYPINSVDAAYAASSGGNVITSTVVNGDVGWHHITFKATVRNFSTIRYNASYPTIDVSTYGNGIYLISMNKSADSFNYKNVSIVNSTINGGAKSDSYQQNIACITTDLAVGASAEVSMDVYLDGSFDQYASIRWVDSIYSNGSAHTTTDITSLFKDGNGDWLKGWNRITFTATVRNFDSLRLNDAYSNLVDTSSFGNAIYVIAQNKDSKAFIFKNVEMTLNYYSLISSANTKGNGFYQNMTGLSTDLEVGTTVQAEMDVYVTGLFNQYSDIRWIDTIYGDGSTRYGSTTIASSFDFTSKTEWQHVTFTATVRNFTSLRWGSAEYNPVDVSAFGNAVYIISQNNSEGLFNYKNVVITAA